ncbi:tail lysozyme [Pantoea phage Kyle]|uniref:Tail lysozyme n=1 Tax=Pantoea phage Kyle TaxID=2589665 RepID=A0A514A8K7_9CAUD|nr:tail lysozyme [Pantoea phage Kyle]QDH49602.1 tail lysozyme [Pantoea phage Kyle]
MASVTILTNENNDIFLPDGRNLSIIKGLPALTQNIRHAHLMRKGEDLYDQENGVDYLGTVFSSPRDEDGARQSIANAILKKEDVKSIETLQISFNGDVMDFAAEIVTVYGDTIKLGS